MNKTRQIDYQTARILVSYSGKCHVLLMGEDSRYQFSGKMVEGQASAFAQIGEISNDGKNRLSLCLGQTHQILFIQRKNKMHLFLTEGLGIGFFFGFLQFEGVYIILWH